jgi:hypothetical protein
MFSFHQERNYPPMNNPYITSNKGLIPHPELLDNSGNLIKEPLLVMRSINVDDAREQLDALYEASPAKRDNQEEA